MIKFILAFLLCCASGATAQTLSSALDWDGGVGGLSAIDVTADGTSFVILNDRGMVLTGRFARGPDHRLLARPMNDSEGVAYGPGGSIYVSYEGRARIWQHHMDGRFIAELPQAPWFETLPRNGALEALAAEGRRLWTMPETWPETARPIWRLNRTWTQVAALETSYSLVGADIGPDGQLYVLERRFSGLSFSGRVQRITPDFSRAETVLTLPPGRHGNLEGLAVWRDPLGALRLIMVSDDNQLSFLPSEIVEYILD